MIKVCGTCIFNIDATIKSGRSGIHVLCAYDNEWRKDSTEGCPKWKETTTGLSKKDRIDLAAKSTDQEDINRRHLEVLRENRESRKYQLKILFLGTLLGIFGTLITQYILALWK